MEGRTSHWFSMSTVLYPSTLLFIVFHNANNDILEYQLIITNHDANNDNLVVQLLSLLVQLLWSEQRQSGVANIINSIYSKCEHRHSELSITIICAFNAQYDPNVNVWGPKKVIYIFLFSRYLEYLRSCSRFMLMLLLIRSRCNYLFWYHFYHAHPQSATYLVQFIQGCNLWWCATFIAIKNYLISYHAQYFISEPNHDYMSGKAITR